jgi:hypothetical protein
MFVVQEEQALMTTLHCTFSLSDVVIRLALVSFIIT